MSWKEIVKLGLMGTDRAGLPESLVAALQQEGIPPDLPEQRLVLEAAALLYQAHRAGCGLQAYTGELTHFDPADLGTLCSPASSHHLQLILSGEFLPALPEFVALLLENGKRLPPETLPALFDRAVADRRFWEQLRLAIGPVGNWLLGQNPEWEDLRVAPGPEAWPSATTPERRRILRRLHRQSPADAVELLRDSWKKENYRDKVAYLAILQENLAPSDIPFLEECLDDRRKEVRQAAAALLAETGTAPLIKRLFKAATSLLRVEGDRLNVLLPNTLHKDWIHDGITKKPAVKYEVSLKASWIMQMVARIPPAKWEKYFQRDAKSCLQLFAGNEFRKGFLIALTEAVGRHGGNDWMQALVTFWIDDGSEWLWENEPAERLLDRLPPELFNQIGISFLEKQGPLIAENTPVALMLARRRYGWDDRLARLLVQGFQNWMTDAGQFYWNTWHYKTLLRSAAYGCNPGLLPQLGKGWPVQSQSWTRWREDVERFLNILRFRKAMHRALSDENKASSG